MSKKQWCISFIFIIVCFLFPVATHAEVEEDKVWTVTFSTPMDEQTIDNSSVRVTSLDGERVDTELEMIDETTLKVHSPSEGYSPGASYLLYISSDVKSKEGEALKDEVVLDFTIEHPESPSNGTMNHDMEEDMDIYHPSVPLKEYGIVEDDIDLMGIAKGGENLSKVLSVNDGELSVPTENGLMPLDTETSYQLKVYMKNGDRHYINFTTSGLPKLKLNDDEGSTFLIPADPAEGFNYPYFLRLPSERHKEDNEDDARRLMVVPNNTGSTNKEIDTLSRTKNEMFGHPLIRDMGERLWAPVLVPAFPRYRVGYEGGYFYTHALDRYSMMLDNMYGDMKTDDRFRSRVDSEGLRMEDINDMRNIDEQLEAMIDHAIAYLNEYGHGIEEDKVFLSGYSAGGNFTNRWAALHPDRVKAVASGGVNSTAIIPMEEKDGEELIYPIGVSDVEEITGEPFNLSAYNDVANFMYQGEEDTNDTFQYNDTFGPEEKDLIREFMGEEMYPTRWNNNKELYFESGAEGAFGLYYGVGHEITDRIMYDLTEFFKDNRSSKKPVYPDSSSYVDVDTEAE
ncbi:Ig-like domain-containing protein [Salimicrobium halophilum]|uniref:SbsA Ig-like domain-containing protein n=1 Tax=Salimicrobium halophilum TaxID=86666 RepID=A0A1G8SD20_9BACI|nr:Ig-like domain-containing protein [Salimicrobium halophilum]SDJ27097.1 hypothetical protein SAMN04490247_1389 [Salimicrobium halophilum]